MPPCTARCLTAMLTAAAAALMIAGCGGSGAAGRVGPAAATGGGSCQRRLDLMGVHGRFAFIRDRGISILDLPSCRTHVLVAQSDAESPLGFSADGRYLAYADGQVIEASGTPAPQRPLGRLLSWAWSPSGAQLAGVGRTGGLSLWQPGGRIRRLIPAGWGATGVAFSPRGELLAVTRSIREAHGVTRQSELWSVDLSTGRRRLLYRTAGIGELGSGIAGFTPDGREVLVWPNTTGSASLAADGLPLAAIPIAGGPARTLVKAMLAYDDYVASCGGSLVVAAGSDRYATSEKSLVRLMPPAYHATALDLASRRSWTSPSCSAAGEIATAASRSTVEAHFGLEHRSIWLIPAGGGSPRRLTSPRSPEVSDEEPRISRNGRYLLYIATRSPPGGGISAAGSLWALPLSGAEGRPIGPIAQLGTAGNYYGHYGWASVTAWHQG